MMRLIDADRLLDFIKFDAKVIAPEEHTAEDIVMMIQTAPTITQPTNDPMTEAEIQEMDGRPVWIDNGYGRNKCYIVNNRYKINGDVEPCGVDLWGTGTSLSLLVRCGVYRRPPNKEESV